MSDYMPACQKATDYLQIDYAQIYRCLPLVVYLAISGYSELIFTAMYTKIKAFALF